MITFLVLDDEDKVSGLLSRVLQKAGYSVFNDPHSHDIIKLARKEDSSVVDSLDRRILEVKGALWKENNGQMYRSLLAEVERPLIEAVLKRTGGNQLKAARLLSPEVETVVGEFGDHAAARTAVDGVERVFLACANHPQQGPWETAVVDAAVAHGLNRLHGVRYDVRSPQWRRKARVMGRVAALSAAAFPK